MTWMPKWCRAVVALLSVTAMTLLFVMPVAWVCTWFGWLPRAQLLPAIMSGEMTALALFAFVLVMALFRARWWCNQVCPVGTFLGLFSRFAVFRPRIDGGKCVKCGLCAKACDKGAIRVRDDKSVAIDHSKCVVCLDCKGSCRKEALKWR